MHRHLALVEDNPAILGNYADFLGGLGFRVDRYGDKAAALKGMLDTPPDMALLDIALHGERDAGFAICAEIRRHNPLLPVIFLTHHDSEMDKISGMRLGADDFIGKGASFDYLVVRIEALFRRLDAYAAAPSIRPVAIPTDGVYFDPATSTVRWRGHRIHLTLTQTWMVQELCKAPGHTRTHEELMRAGKLSVAPNTIAAHMKAIRDAFTRVDAGFDQIRTERNRGYRWVPQ